MGQPLSITFTRGPKQGKSFKILGEEVKIGRGSDNDIVIDDKNLSRHHLALINTNKGLLIKDLNSTNGVFCNRKKVAELLLGPQDEISFGDSTFMLKNAARAHTAASPTPAAPQGSTFGLGLQDSAPSGNRTSTPEMGLASSLHNAMGNAAAAQSGKQRGASKSPMSPQTRKRLKLYGGAGAILGLALFAKSMEGPEAPPPPPGGDASQAATGIATDVVIEDITAPNIHRSEEGQTYTKALLLYDVGKTNQALELITGLVKLNPDNTLYKIKRTEWLAERDKQADELLLNASLKTKNKYYDAAISDYKRVIQLVPSDRDPKHLKAQQALRMLENVRNSVQPPPGAQ